MLGYEAPTTTVTLTFPTEPDVTVTSPDVTVTSVNGWIVLFSRDTPVFQGDRTWNDLEVTWNVPDSVGYDLE